MHVGKQVDAAIIGGGPAGCATAIELARHGRSVWLVEREQYERVRIGETLPPRARPLLASLGLPINLAREGHMPVPGILSAWGSADAHCNDFIVNPYGNGWHLDRPRFDRMLGGRACDLGVTLHERTTVTACEPEGDGWRVGLNGDGVPATLSCRFLVDATGRRASPVKRRAGRRAVHDRLIGVAAFMPAAQADRRTLIEATCEGWWYSALLPEDRQIAVHMTDADTITRGPGGLSAFLEERLRNAPLTRERFGTVSGAAHVQPFAAMTCAYERVHGDNWLLAGDAAMTWDPLSGQGICKALESGMRAGRAIDQALDGDGGGLADYAHWTRARFADYLRASARYYGAERRWPQAAFWRRRHVPGPVPSASHAA